MFALTDILSFEGEKTKSKILKPVWVVTAEYLVKFLVLLSLLFAGLQVTSGSFECLPAVKCPGISKANALNSSLLSEKIYRKVCKSFYSSRNTSYTEDTYVITDIKTIVQYARFVTSECSKSAIPEFLAYFWIVLFAESFVLLLLGNLWLKLPTTASFVENFVTLVIECYKSPCSTQVLGMPTAIPHEDEHAEMLEREPASRRSRISQTVPMELNTDNSATGMSHEKVKQFKDNIKSSHKFVTIRLLYLLQCSLQTIFALGFFATDVVFIKDLEGRMTCTITDDIHIPVPHEYFICSHGLAPTFAFGLKWVYLPTLALSLFIFVFFMLSWTAWKIFRKCEYDVETKKLPTIVSCRKRRPGIPAAPIAPF